MKPLAFLLFVFLFFTFYVLRFTSPAHATVIDISPSPVPGETIEIKTTIGTDKQIPGKIGPQPDKLLFPNVSKPLEFLSDPDISKKALPASLTTEFKEKEEPLKGKIAHVVCGGVKALGQKTVKDPDTGKEATVPASETGKDAYAVSNPVDFETTEDWGKLILHSRFVQSFLVPGKGTDLTFELGTPRPQSVPTRLADCPGEPGGEGSKTIQVTNRGPQTFNPLEGLIGAIGNFFNDLLSGRIFGTTIEANVKQIKYLEGETQLKDQTVGQSGLLNSFLPSTMLKDADQVEKVPYQVPGKTGTQQVEVNYSQTKALDQRTADVIKSLYPAVLAANIGPGDTAPPPVTGPGLTYTIPYRDTSISISPERREQVMKQVLSNPKWSTSKIRELWDRVESEALRARINPAFMLAIWIEESGGSTGSAQSDFGCFPGGDTSQTVSFERSLACFVNFTNDHPNNFEEWTRYFCGDKVVPICSNNPNFLTNLKIWYDRIAK